MAGAACYERVDVFVPDPFGLGTFETHYEFKSNDLTFCADPDIVGMPKSVYESLLIGDPNPTPAGDAVTIDPDQVDLILSTTLVLTMCLAFCVGWLCHENGAK